jgi:inorganic pyrophosphatase
MRHAIEHLEAMDKKRNCVNVVVETPKGSRVKYAYISSCGLFWVKRALPEGMVFPFNFGFIPSTVGEDGDALDILILNEESVLSGSLLKVKLVGVIKAEQKEDGERIHNDRIIGMAIPEETPPEYYSLELDKKRLAQINFFFKAYTKLYGKKFKVLGNEGPEYAKRLVKEGMRKFKKRKN